jgi:hypothetical protein
MTRGDIVLMDTNVIIESYRTRCWGALVNTFKVETVENAGKRLRPVTNGVRATW